MWCVINAWDRSKTITLSPFKRTLDSCTGESPLPPLLLLLLRFRFFFFFLSLLLLFLASFFFRLSFFFLSFLRFFSFCVGMCVWWS